MKPDRSPSLHADIDPAPVPIKPGFISLQIKRRNNNDNNGGKVHICFDLHVALGPVWKGSTRTSHIVVQINSHICLIGLWNIYKAHPFSPTDTKSETWLDYSLWTCRINDVVYPFHSRKAWNLNIKNSNSSKTHADCIDISTHTDYHTPNLW